VTIVGNLIDNALDALRERVGGRVEVSLLARDGRVRIQVRDDGPGIPAGALGHVFEPGWSTKPGTAAGRRGLGLALVSTAATRLGGHVEAVNDDGAVLTVDLPAAAPPRVAAR
jgi:two-component system, CitB family, sensor kinase